jgi:hypothetical protein
MPNYFYIEHSTMEQTEVESTKKMQGSVGISFTRPTPMWATWMFRIVFNLTLGAVIWIGGTGFIEPKTKVECLLALKVLDNLIWTIARGLGVKKTTEVEGKE